MFLNRLKSFTQMLVLFLILASCQEKKITNQTNLIDKSLSKWDIFMGVPHTSVDLPDDVPKFDDVRDGIPIGLNKDPKKVFSVIEENGEEIIKITGEIYAGLVTKKDYENYHLKWQFKWGEKKWEPRIDKKRNSGVLYHSVGDYTDFWKVWMTSLECEVQETDCGDFITIGHGNVTAKCNSTKAENGKYYFDPKGVLNEYAWAEGYETGRCWKPGDPEKPIGEWNTMELICFGDTSIHILNNQVVMVVKEPKGLLDGQWKPMTKGKIQIQSEAAEVFYKNIIITPIEGFDEKYKVYL